MISNFIRKLFYEWVRPTFKYTYLVPNTVLDEESDVENFNQDQSAQLAF